MNWNDIAKEYAHLAAPVLAPTLAFLVAVLMMRLLWINRKTQRYAKMVLDLVAGKLEATMGAKSADIVENWNQVANEVSAQSNGREQAYSHSYFVTRMSALVKLNANEVDALREVLAWLDGGEVSASDVQSYKFPQLPCPCELKAR